MAILALSLSGSMAFATTYQVTNANDSGAGSLRQAILDTNANVGADIIEITSQGVLTLASVLPTPYESVTIDGPGSAAFTIDAQDLGQVMTIGQLNGGQSYVIEGVAIRGGYNDGDGGALYLTGGNGLSLQNCNISHNTATRNGGAIRANGPLDVIGTTFEDNEGGNIGGAIFHSSDAGALNIENSIFHANYNDNKGGAVIGSGETTILDSHFSGNSSIDGGAVFFSESTLTIERSTFTDNQASWGGALSLRCYDAGDTCSADIIDSTFYANMATHDTVGKGGGLYSIQFHDIDVRSSTFSANSADVYGGGLYTDWGTTLALLNTTIADNSGVTGAGGIYVDSSTLGQIANNLLANNPGGNCRSLNVSGSHNLSSDSTCGFNGAADFINTNPLIAELADNGGPTEDHDLLPGSPAIGKGNNATCPALDQRGNARIGSCEIGAVEYLPEPALAALQAMALMILAGLHGTARRRR